MNKKEVLKIFNKTGVLQKGHFLLSSGYHSDRYLQCAQVLQYPELSKRLAKSLAKKFKRIKINVVAGPALGGIILAYEMANQLNPRPSKRSGMNTRAIFAEREEGRMKLRRNFKIKKGEQVLVVEDVLTTGSSIKEVIDLVREEGGEIIGAGCLVDRSTEKIDFGVKLESLLRIEIKNYKKEECPLCKKGVPVLKPGSRK